MGCVVKLGISELSGLSQWKPTQKILIVYLLLNGLFIGREIMRTWGGDMVHWSGAVLGGKCNIGSGFSGWHLPEWTALI